MSSVSSPPTSLITVHTAPQAFTQHKLSVGGSAIRFKGTFIHSPSAMAVMHHVTATLVKALLLPCHLPVLVGAAAVPRALHSSLHACEQQQQHQQQPQAQQQHHQQQQQQQQQKAQHTAQVGRLNHVAIAVPDLQQAAARYRSVLGAKVSAPQPVPEHGVAVVFVELPNTKIELLHPLGEGSPIAKFLQRNPAGACDVRRRFAWPCMPLVCTCWRLPRAVLHSHTHTVGGIHHVCLEVADVGASLAALTPAGMRVLDPTPKIGAHGNPVVFLHPKDNDGVLLELEEVGGDGGGS
jgi:methylmalonyl-CoA/ethylmalonyl-CoA epimerase